VPRQNCTRAAGWGCFQGASYLAHTPGLKPGLKPWATIYSRFAAKSDTLDEGLGSPTSAEIAVQRGRQVGKAALLAPLTETA
jgi:hypothetical protein